MILIAIAGLRLYLRAKAALFVICNLHTRKITHFHTDAAGMIPRQVPHKLNLPECDLTPLNDFLMGHFR